MTGGDPLSDAKACLAAHDPFQPVLDYLDRITDRIEAAGQNISSGPVAITLDVEQVRSLTFATERAAERGVSMYARRIRSWHQAIVGGAFVAGLSIGGLCAWYWHPATDISGMTCQDQAGGRFCAIWVTPPRQASDH